MKHQEWEPQATYDQPKEETTRQDTTPSYLTPTEQLHRGHMNGWEFLQWLLSGTGERIAAVWEWLIDDDGWVWVAILLPTVVALLAGIFHWMK